MRRLERVDLPFYREHLAEFLPERIVDAHVHLASPACAPAFSEERKRSHWALTLPRYLTARTLGRLYELLFAGKRITPICFGFPYRETRYDVSNAYVAQAAREHGFAGLLMVNPRWAKEEIAGRLLAGGFVGFKPYPDLVNWKPADEVGVFDCLTQAQLELADDMGLLVYLHLPRKERLRDAQNQRDIRGIVRRYPRVKLVLPHIGRSYCTDFARQGLAALRDCPSVIYDTSANLNADVYELALREVGPQRLLYGSDLPLLLLRGTRAHIGDTYINHVIGDFWWNTERRPSEEEDRYTFMLYESIRAFQEAARRVGLSREDVRDVFCNNAARLLRGIHR